MNQQATKDELANHSNMHVQSISRYLKSFIDAQIIERVSEKQRDPDALYLFKSD